MRRFTTNINFVSILVLVAVIVITYTAIFLPMRAEHEKIILNNFVLSALISINKAEEDNIVPFMEGVEISKIDEDRALKIISNYTRYEWIGEGYLINNGKYISYIISIPNTNNCWYIRIKKDILFRPVRRISSISFHFILGLSLLFLLINFMSIKNMRKAVQKLENSKRKYKEYAIRDALTGTYSRLFFQNWILKKPDMDLSDIDSLSAIIMIDLDGFKKVNDTYGHLVGDNILIRIADILKSSVREGDYVIRYGGDEFIILLKECDISFCENIISRIEAKIKELDKYNIKMSYGIEKIEDKSKLLDYIKNADEKMYQMKKQKHARYKKS